MRSGASTLNLHEVDCRRDDWISGIDIQLDGGEPWTFPVPRNRYVFRMIDPAEGDKFENLKVVREPSTSDDNRLYSQKFWDAQAVFRAFAVKIDENTKQEAFGRAAFGLAADLLRRNYDLSDDQVMALLTIRLGDDSNKSMWLAIAEVILHTHPDQQIGTATADATQPGA